MIRERNHMYFSVASHLRRLESTVQDASIEGRRLRRLPCALHGRLRRPHHLREEIIVLHNPNALWQRRPAEVGSLFFPFLFPFLFFFPLFFSFLQMALVTPRLRRANTEKLPDFPGEL